MSRLSSELEVRRLDRERRADFDRVHCEANGAGWCRCAAWWVPTWDGWGERTAEQNHALRDELFARNEYDGYLLYRDGAPVGWCQVGPRDRLPKLVAQFELEPDPETWAITCFVVAPRDRRRGLASALLGDVVRDLAARGVRRVEAYPRLGEGLDEVELWNGPAAMFRRAGFQLVRELGPCGVLALAIEAP